MEKTRIPEVMPPVLGRVQAMAQPESGPQFSMELITFSSREVLDRHWETIKPYVAELADASAGEYDPYFVYLDLFSGRSQLYIGYLIEADGSKTFVGYALMRLDPGACHLWQVYILEKHRHTNILQMGAEFIEREVRNIGAKHITFSTLREWGDAVEKMGFKRTYTLYRKELKPEGGK